MTNTRGNESYAGLDKFFSKLLQVLASQDKMVRNNKITSLKVIIVCTT